VANSLAAVRAGVRQIECTINGIGERAGNASLEEIVVALRVRQASFGVKTDIQLDKIYATSRLLSEITGVAVPPNKAVVARTPSRTKPESTKIGILKNPLTYEIILPKQLAFPSGN